MILYEICVKYEIGGIHNFQKFFIVANTPDEAEQKALSYVEEHIGVEAHLHYIFRRASENNKPTRLLL